MVLHRKLNHCFKCKELIREDQKNLIFELRVKTGIGLFAGKKALEDNNWNFNKTIDNIEDYLWNGKLYDTP